MTLKMFYIINTSPKKAAGVTLRAGVHTCAHMCVDMCVHASERDVALLPEAISDESSLMRTRRVNGTFNHIIMASAK